MTYMSLCLICGTANPLETKFCSQCRSKLLIQARYRALKVIGQGGFGKTFLAQDEGKPSKPKCVIKQFIYDDPSSLQKAQELFEQEAVRLDDLGKHNQIPELLAHCEQEGRQYLVQEFIDGENLLQELQRSGRFSEAKIKDLLLDLLPVLQFIHTGNVIHRDIKPENIIRRRSDGKLVLVDFGAAKVTSQTTLAKTGTEIGSAEYTAPEQTRGKAVFASDIYALGVTCIYLLTQIPPFDLFSDHEDAWVWRQFLNGNSVDNDLGIILDKMLEKALGKRYQSVNEILQVLQKSYTLPSITLNNPSSQQFKTQSSIAPIAALPRSKPQVSSVTYPKSLPIYGKSRTTAILWCFFLGAFGAHKFYLGQSGWGIVYLLFCWTGIPSFAAFIEFIMLLVMSDAEFNRRFNGGLNQATASVKDSTAALGDLKRLYDDGIITAEEYEEKRKKLLKNI